MVQNDKKLCPLHSISQQLYIIWLSFMVHICKMIIVFRWSFPFLKILIFWVHGVGEQKTVQNDKKCCLSRSISAEPYIIWLLFMVHIYKMIMSPGSFYFFKILIFRVVRGVKGQKKSPEWQKILSVTHSISQEPYIIWLSFMVNMCKVIISAGGFSFFQNFDFLGC